MNTYSCPSPNLSSFRNVSLNVQNHRDAGLVILPAYYAASLSMDQEQIIQYYVDICHESPVRLSLPPTYSSGNTFAHSSDPPLLIQFPCECCRPGHVVSSHRGCDTQGAEFVWRQTHVSVRLRLRAFSSPLTE
jgi:hypothetical protein